MIYATVCSGIEAPSVAWAGLGWTPRFFSEIEPFPRAVLACRYPDVPCHGDFTTIGESDYGPIDLLCAGTPCQDFSVAGLRAGLAGERGGLTLEFARLALRLRPRWVVWENVPGIFSVDRGLAFHAFLDLLGQCGYPCAYRILDAQYFGVPQRRRRVFVVGYLGDWRPAAAVLFEPSSLRGDTPPRREAEERVARPIAACSAGGSGYRNDADTTDNLTIVTHSLRANGFDASEDGTGRGTPLVAFAENSRAELRLEGGDGQVAASLKTGGGKPGQSYPAVVSATSVRRLTPRECERLQGLPDDYTAITYRGKPAADGPRYRAIGNSMAVPVVRWLGERISMVQTLHAPR